MQWKNQKRPRPYKEQTESQDNKPHESLESQFDQATNPIEINKHLDDIKNEI